MRFLNTTRCWCRLAGSFSCELLTRSFATGGLTGCLLCACHVLGRSVCRSFVLHFCGQPGLYDIRVGSLDVTNFYSHKDPPGMSSSWRWIKRNKSVQRLSMPSEASTPKTTDLWCIIVKPELGVQFLVDRSHVFGSSPIRFWCSTWVASRSVWNNGTTIHVGCCSAVNQP